ncbi:phosphoribosylaminoimidazolesuccinocarboxamide synthase [Halarchaeum nitratireducens]|uniref:Phosphoribosylaminoimidazole-succinocarboxamide synthase n=1 Tax=Halarchaeum nitratireducens TaxID=489913 RepID=A0A830G7T8_9EURY|nr:MULTISPECIES: phosphoribosylaminoimidazolesuccinocarboxamide synthase [Halarchaeum]MBP2251297.1 phosphoribosylaminoimidazole-succinocarboxamide synthase [Halarchaeum solikamskense]GGN07069.1 phosphoribosylaminoimidazolesuccinocarboxamide synthase [Halarchaeum nitratireducens]
MTSVKDLRVADAPTREAAGRGRFAFTDDYSVFDWGKMPDQIPQKGAALCTMGAYNFELLEAAGVPTHYRGVVDAGDAERVVDLDSAGTPPTEMAIDLVRVPDLPFADGDYDYDAFHAEAGSNYVVPLEIVFRNTVPVGSSLRSRASPEEYGLDVAEWPAEPVTLADPVVEFSTKFEEQDRYVDDAEADRIAGDAAVADLESLARRVNDVVTERAEAAGFEHQDGKIECAVIDGEVVVADVVGTFDENRFSYRGQQVSKEVVRQFYKSYDPTWVDAVSEAKAEADREGVADWRELCGTTPERLPEDVIETVSALYRAGTNAYAGSEWFDAPDIDAAVDAVRDL